MSEIKRHYPVTRIRGELHMTPQVNEAVSRFLKEPLDPEALSMFTTAQALLDQRDFHGNQYELAVRRVMRTFQKLGNRALVLAPPLALQSRKDGSGRLLFSVREDDEEYLRQVTASILLLPTLERKREERAMLAVEFPSESLAADLSERYGQMSEADKKISAELRHPTALHRMAVTGLRLVARDVDFPVSVLSYLPDDLEA
jgi:hypothetical protein